ncbi:AAC(3) family N-acetyltransferase [Actinomadura sp. ATCC 31491]|uniref:Aminoglycoside N(3)-acetyltransferase n=1 Tax=Actinomadura luzonensis TaxID=2805427 RepID=A0ABT0G504_9ACTN|nr:AAC(3) family N-acetyltransferase [Actinomadura luzonensis]MCK2219655.1 AAC(3) family N-acetyltransferase [Actinomadura luzonensis]
MGFGQVVLLHSSLRSLGPVEGGAGTVVAALRGLLGPDGTLAVPTGTSGNSDTSPLYRAAVAGMTAAEVAAYRDRMPAFDPATTPSQGMGVIAEHVRTLPGARRSGHPQTSLAAVGPLAARITGGHARDCLLGERSPIARLYDAGARVLLLGVGYDKCTAFHLAEYRRTAHPPRRTYRAVVDDGDGRGWCEFEDVALDAGDFPALGAAFEETGVVRRGRVGAAGARLFPLRSAVDYAVDWLAANRPRVRG